MRHAFLIIAHNNWWQLKRLIHLLDAENHDIYIHIDKKSKEFNERDFDNVARYSEVAFWREYEVFWGSFSLVETELFLFEKAHQKGYDYYHLISGADLPLKGSRELDRFFDENKGKQFIHFIDMELKDNPKIARRMKYYHFLQNYESGFSHKWMNELLTFCERVLLVIQMVFRINRIKNLDWKIKYGSQWVSITDELVVVLLREKNRIKKVFSYTNCADEHFVQTIAYNCGFRDQIYHPQNGQEANVRFIDWSHGNPYIFTSNDAKVILNNENFFARKFSESVDRGIIETICQNVEKRNETK
ncbi:MAG: beta-1,6-N-acetylglucosaminyltransferase [Agathobacter sp.]